MNTLGKTILILAFTALIISVSSCATSYNSTRQPMTSSKCINH